MDTYNECMDRFRKYITKDKLRENPVTIYEDFVLGVCMDHLDIIQNSVKPSFCSFMSLYSLRYLKQAVVHDGQDIDLFAADFCSNAKDSAKARMLLLNDIFTVGPKSTLFDEKCMNGLKNAAIMNPWYFPTVPTTLLSFGDVCQSYKELFLQMDSKNIHSLTKAAQFSVILTLELDFNSKEDKLFNECTDSIVQKDPMAFCKDDIVGESAFSLWTDLELQNLCASAAT